MQKDFVHAYALLLLAYSDGMAPVGKTAFIPVLGDDEHELEIVQFGSQLSADELDSAETLAKKLAQKKGKLANPETAGPTKVAEFDQGASSRGRRLQVERRARDD